jgi:hypothetical protein
MEFWKKTAEPHFFILTRSPDEQKYSPQRVQQLLLHAFLFL